MAALKQKNPILLRQSREKIYAGKIHKMTFISKAAALNMLKRGSRGQVYSVPSAGIRLVNFELIVKTNFTRNPDPYASGSQWPETLTGFPPYETLKSYAKTDYGAMMFNRILQDNKVSSKPFKITIKGDGAAGNENEIFLPDDFGVQGVNGHIVRFGGDNDGQKVDYLAIIHHEFRHTRFWGKKQNATVSLEDERDAVIYNENPVRILNDFEPRYTYYDGKHKSNQTINIVSGIKIAGKFGVKAEDPQVFVRRGEKGSMTEFWK